MVNIKKALQVVKHIGLAQGLHRRVGQGHLVALGHGKNQLGLKRSFDVHVQFGLGHALQQLGQALGRNVVNE